MEDSKVKTELINCIRELQHFFDKHDVRAWVMKCELTIQKLEKEKGNTKSIVNNFTGAGMGSLLDIIIDNPSNNHNLHDSSYKDANQELEALIKNFHNASSKAKNNYLRFIKSFFLR